MVVTERVAAVTRFKSVVPLSPQLSLASHGVCIIRATGRSRRRVAEEKDERVRVTEIVRLSERGVCVVEKKRNRIVGRVAKEKDEGERERERWR